MMRPLSSMVAASMAKGLYSTSSSGELGSAVFESWTMVNGGREKAARPKAVRWKIDDEFMSSSSKKKNRSGGYAHTHTCILYTYIVVSPFSSDLEKAQLWF
ncbi:hypothetical protein RHGRI_027437 [Rhododendron griersonianum]|uniref:Uncharacterized protein n=1 Tax=Rhododendron griersonianum TaxID=479676 RepID=A0AAV6IZ70_9ERIC|nr:hypothetical protein RHGRI_027437 [Rhododendron griersonianum]